MTNKEKSAGCHITLTINGRDVGTIREWKPKPTEPISAVDYKPSPLVAQLEDWWGKEIEVQQGQVTQGLVTINTEELEDDSVALSMTTDDGTTVPLHSCWWEGRTLSRKPKAARFGVSAAPT